MRVAIYAIGDLHLSFGTTKPMDIFRGWKDYVARLCESWNAQVLPDDTVVLAGDTSWGMSLEEALPDFRWIDALPGKKILLKGNHDYWWTSRRKMEECFEENRLHTLRILHNNSYEEEDAALCGTRGWMLDETTAHDKKIGAREEGRLRASLRSAGDTAGEKIVFLHYPPVYQGQISGTMLDVMHEYGVRRCFYGHLHGQSCRAALEGMYEGIDFCLISADHLGFRLKRIQ